MDRRKKGEYIGALGALLVHVAVIALLILVSFTVPQPLCHPPEAPGDLLLHHAAPIREP